MKRRNVNINQPIFYCSNTEKNIDKSIGEIN